MGDCLGASLIFVGRAPMSPTTHLEDDNDDKELR